MSGRVRVASALACAVLLLAACGGQQATTDGGQETTADYATEGKAAEATTLSVDATEPAAGQYKFGGVPATVSGGLVKVQLKNSGAQPHEFQLVRLDRGHTLDEVKMHFTDSEEGAPIPDWIHGAGGTGVTAPGQTTSASVVLDEGQYVFLCLLTDEKDVERFQNGMLGSFEVRGDDAAAALPKADAVITAQEYSFDVPALKAGKNTIEFKNAGAQLHHVQMFPLSPGKTIEDVKTFFMTEGEPSGPPPVDFERGAGTAVTDGGTGFVTEIDLAAGEYALVCFLTDRTGGPPHFLKGMLQAVTIE